MPSHRARELAARAADRHGDETVALLGELVAFETVAHANTPNAENPAVRAMSARLAAVADDYGLDFADHGAVVVIGLGSGPARLGIITHGDVQPADASKWARSPFELDQTSEPGRLVGRGVEDDKGPIACALTALRTLGESGLTLSRRIELIVSYTEESDWAPFTAFLEEHAPPSLNIGFDAEYPVVVAEKGWCDVRLALPLDVPHMPVDGPSLASFTGGSFLSQVPEDARAVVADAGAAIEERLRARAPSLAPVTFAFEREGTRLTVTAHGRSAHSSKPWEGANAITHLAELLAPLPTNTPAGRMARLVRDLVGTGWRAERFGGLAYSDDFMGPLTLSLGTLSEADGRLVAAINLRRPVGRTGAEVEAEVHAAVRDWLEREGGDEVEVSAYIGEPHAPVDAPHVAVLLDTFRAFTGSEDAAPISIGGGTHARLVPNGVNFGPAMPGEVYTGHSEHEFMTRAQLLLNLRMLTSALVDLAGS